MKKLLIYLVLPSKTHYMIGVRITWDVATLTLGLRPRQRGCKVAGQEEAQESHHILLGV
jgi:hypothetical protein